MPGHAAHSPAGSPAAPHMPQAQQTRWSRAIACVCFEVTGPTVTASQWRPGPLPVELPDGRHADRLARATYFQARAAGSLYGLQDGSSLSRWHRTGDAAAGDDALLGVELLAFPHFAAVREGGIGPGGPGGADGRYLCVLHLALSHKDPLASLAAAVRLNPGDEACAQRRDLYAELIGDGFRVSPDVRRALSVSLITFRSERWAPPRGTPRQWAATDGWLWAAASATPLQQFCPDPEDPHVLDGLVYLSSSWRALVLRDGIGFAGLVPDSGDKASFFAWGETYVRTLYTDVALLAALERDALDGFANRLAHIGNRFEKSPEFRSLVNEVTEFRNIFWWENVTRHGNANSILEQLHAAHRTPQLFARVVSDLDAFRQQVEAQALEKSVQVQEAEENRSRRFEHAASIAAIAITVPLLVFTALVLPIHGLTGQGHELSGWLVMAIGIGSMLIGAIVGAAGGRWISRRDA
jgi:hypothetical protein